MQPKDKSYRVFLENKIRELENHNSELEARLWDYDNDIDLIIYDKVKNVNAEFARRHESSKEPHLMLVRFKNNTIYETLTCSDRKWYNLWEWWSRDTGFRRNIDMYETFAHIERWREEDAESNS